jgi:hypothetical protein
MQGFRIRRDVAPGTYRLEEVFQGLEASWTLRRLYPDDDERRRRVAKQVLEVVDEDTYCYVDPEKRRIVLGWGHLRETEDAILYLDILHEMVHVRQAEEGKELFDRRFPYVDRPTEVEAYALVVEEARRMGLGDAAILDYLSVEWVTPRDRDRLAARLGVTTAERETSTTP